jgi:hypothetical protein
MYIVIQRFFLTMLKVCINAKNKENKLKKYLVRGELDFPESQYVAIVLQTFV